jgi:hypothetical protein
MESNRRLQFYHIFIAKGKPGSGTLDKAKTKIKDALS